mgnify:FL=1
MILTSNEIILMCALGLFSIIYILFVKKKFGKKVLLVLISLGLFLFLGQVSLNAEFSYEMGNFYRFSSEIEKIIEFNEYEVLIEKTVNKKESTSAYKPYLYKKVSSIYYRSNQLETLTLINYESKSHLNVYYIQGKEQSMIWFEQVDLEIELNVVSEQVNYEAYSYVIFNNLEELALPDVVINEKSYTWLQ